MTAKNHSNEFERNPANLDNIFLLGECEKILRAAADLVALVTLRLEDEKHTPPGGDVQPILWGKRSSGKGPGS